VPKYLNIYSTPVDSTLGHIMVNESNLNILSLGIYLQYEANRYKISHLVENSSAERAGLKIGDFIMSIDGKNFNVYNQLRDEIIRVYNGIKKQSVIEVLRGNNKLYFTLTK